MNAHTKAAEQGREGDVERLHKSLMKQLGEACAHRQEAEDLDARLLQVWLEQHIRALDDFLKDCDRARLEALHPLFILVPDGDIIRESDEVYRCGTGPWVPVQQSDIGHHRDPQYAPMRRRELVTR